MNSTKTKPKGKSWLSVNELAEYYGVHRATVFRWVKQAIEDNSVKIYKHKGAYFLSKEDKDAFAPIKAENKITS